MESMMNFSTKLLLLLSLVCGLSDLDEKPADKDGAAQRIVVETPVDEAPVQDRKRD